MANKKWDGWTNYTTWRIYEDYLEDFFKDAYKYFDGQNIDVTAEDVKNIVYDAIVGTELKGIDFELKFVENVNWQEIADSTTNTLKLDQKKDVIKKFISANKQIREWQKQIDSILDGWSLDKSIIEIRDDFRRISYSIEDYLADN